MQMPWSLNRERGGMGPPQDNSCQLIHQIFDAMPYTEGACGEVDEYLSFLQKPEGGGSLDQDELVSVSSEKCKDDAYRR